ncbi:hypothetical protein LCGC14_2450670 [marine sediment metagenome]|uniref:Uncharacterized protein n=1 Tax=marine sediment metagenome TaxID=412755 RepID=A0A0F9C3W1_9ZZZZ
MPTLGQVIGKDKARLDKETDAQIGDLGAISYFELPRETFNVDLVSYRIEKDYPDLGSTFALDHDTMGSLSFSRLGRVGSVLIRAVESKIYEDVTENFSDTSNLDAGSSTGVWGPNVGSKFVLNSDGNGYEGANLDSYPLGSGLDGIFFDSGSIIQTTNIGSDLQLATTKINRVRVELIGSNYDDVIGSVTTNNAGSWTPMTLGLTAEVIAEETGSQILIKLIDIIDDGI